MQCHDIVLRHQQQLTTLPVATYQAAHPTVPLHSYHSIANTLTLLHHTATTSPATLTNTLQADTPLTPAAISTLHTAYTAHNNNTAAAQQQSRHTPLAYLDMQWKVGATLGDSAGGGSGVYVVLCVSSVDEVGSGVSEQCVELSVSEFRAFHRRIKEIAAQMDNM